MFVLWILLYVVGFVATTLVMKYFKMGGDIDPTWGMAMILWPVFVPCGLLIMGFTNGGAFAFGWWDKASDRIVEKLKNMSPRSSVD